MSKISYCRILSLNLLRKKCCTKITIFQTYVAGARYPSSYAFQLLFDPLNGQFRHGPFPQTRKLTPKGNGWSQEKLVLKNGTSI